MSRCFGCCQENCGYIGCSCACHSDEELEAKRRELEVIDAEFEEVPKKEILEIHMNMVSKSAFSKWRDWWQLACDHHAEPEPDQAWDGCIDTVCCYIREYGHKNDNTEFVEGMEELIEKLQKFKVIK
jgi:hypothetical protein